jgi:hypothetical protein
VLSKEKMKIYFKRCHNCLTNELVHLQEAVNVDVDWDVPLLPEGFYKTEDEVFDQSLGRVMINEKDLVNYKDHWDGIRFIGCCGPSGYDGPNKICGNCGAEVATLSNDCFTHYFISFVNDSTYIKEQFFNIFTT